MPNVYGVDSATETHVNAAIAIAKDVAAPNAGDVDGKGRFPEEAIAALSAKGLTGLCVATSLGGLGQGPRAFVAITEELAKTCASTAMIYVMHVTAAQAIASSTTLAGKDDLLREIARGKHLSTLAFSE